MKTTTASPSQAYSPDSYRESPPYVVFHIDTPTGHIYQVNGKGFSTEHFDEATRYPVTPETENFRLKGAIGGSQIIGSSAPLYITSASDDLVELTWGNTRLSANPDRLNSQVGGEVWSKLRHLRRGGYPFGPVVKIATDDQDDSIAIFNIRIFPPTGRAEFLHPAPDDWLSCPRSIQTHLGLLGFRFKGRPDSQAPSIWRRDLGELTLELKTGIGCRPESLSLLRKNKQPERIALTDSTRKTLHALLRSFITASSPS